ncbi:MAG: hypothetical protein ACI8WY_002559, partial [Planctomycetota bacterium]
MAHLDSLRGLVANELQHSVLVRGARQRLVHEDLDSLQGALGAEHEHRASPAALHSKGHLIPSGELTQLHLHGLVLGRGQVDLASIQGEYIPQLEASVQGGTNRGLGHSDVIRRIRRVLDRYDLDPIALGLPPIPGGTDAGEFPDDCADASNQEQPLLDFGDARDDSFFPELKA